MKAKLSITVGLPGSGKSTWLKERRENGQYAVVLCPDDFRFDLTGQYYYPPAEDDVWAQVKRAARVLLRNGYHVIIDATSLTAWSRKQWVKLAQTLEVPIDAYIFITPKDICLERNAERDRVVPPEVINRMAAGFQEVDENEGFDAIHTIKGT